MKLTTTKRIVWFLVINGVLWVWCSYILAWFGREIAESLSKLAVTEIIAVTLAYCFKSLLEKRCAFGGVGVPESHWCHSTGKSGSVRCRESEFQNGCEAGAVDDSEI